MTKKNKEKPEKAIKPNEQPLPPPVKNTLDFDKAMEIIVNVKVDKGKKGKNI